MIRHRLALTLLMLTVGSTAVVLACSSSDSGGSSGTTSSTTTTVHVSAAAGGTVADPGGKTTLTIPPGALAKDTDITLAITPKSGSAVVDVSEFGPDGLQFLKPVTLSIKADAALAAKDKSLALAVNDGADFKAIEGSTYANGAATASIMHFSKYTIVQINGRVILQPPATCVAALAGFTPCGGDPKGTWTIADYCVPQQDLGTGLANCPEATAAIDLTFMRDVTIDATQLTIGAGSQKTVFTFNFPIACLSRDGDGGTVDAGIGSCADFQTKYNTKNAAKPITCVDTTAGSCSCAEPETKDAPAETSTYTTSGNNITITDSAGKVETSEYCVSNNLMSVKGAGKDGGLGGIFVLNRK